MVELKNAVVENGIGVLIEPFTKTHKLGLSAGDGFKTCHMQVAKDESVDIRTLPVVRLGKLKKSGKSIARWWPLAGRFAPGAVAGRPPRCHCGGPPWMNGGIEPLAHGIVETPAGEAVHGWLATHIIAMGKEDAVPIKVDSSG